ncbi:MAG: TraB/GumN family protein [Desulfobacterales bacterium]|nr:MAG: TraB/GumN family protein [Desulfobacterales bacterium]
MLFRRSRQKEIKMIWEVVQSQRKSYVVGTAHFFPYSFRTSLSPYLKTARTAIFEGPLDEENLAKVLEAGCTHEEASPLLDDLGHATVLNITKALAPSRRNTELFFIPNFRTGRMENPVYDMVKGMKPWLAFFTIWSTYLKKNGWKYSVDLEGYTIARELGKQVVFLETIEEQIQVLESLSYEKILAFLKSVDRWHEFAQEYLTCYLDGNLKKLKSMRLRFPSRHPSIIDRRDAIFYERMLPYLQQGEAVVFVGAPHVRGLSRMLSTSGYQFKRPGSPSKTGATAPPPRSG